MSEDQPVVVESAVADSSTTFSLLAVDVDRRNDIALIETWLLSQTRSIHTTRAFRHEAYRWLSWLIWHRVTTRGATRGLWLNQADFLDSTAFAHWLQAPTVLPDWALIPSGKGIRQPIVKALVKSSHARALTVISSLYKTLCMVPIDGYHFDRNPFVNQKNLASGVRKRAGRHYEKALNEFDRQYVARALAQIELEKEPDAYQLRWIWIALSLTGLRRSELAAATADMIVYKVDDEQQMGWVLHVTGKGEVTADIPLNIQFMQEFARYREHFDLSPLPSSTGRAVETTPLVLPLHLERGEDGLPIYRACSDKLIYRAVKRLMSISAGLASAAGEGATASRLDAFAAHSARHTFCTRIVRNTGDITIARDAARHGSILTTQKYVARDTSRSRRAIDDLADFAPAPPLTS